MTTVRTFIKAMSIGLLFLVLFYGYQVISGLYLTMNHVPDVVKGYESANLLQREIAFGVVSHSGWPIQEAGIGLLGIICYYAAKFLKSRRG
jgi:hypothetical protein